LYLMQKWSTMAMCHCDMYVGTMGANKQSSVWKSDSVRFFALIWKNWNRNWFPVSHPLPKPDWVDKNWFPLVAGMQKDRLSQSEPVHLEPVTTFQWLTATAVKTMDSKITTTYRVYPTYIKVTTTRSAGHPLLSPLLSFSSSSQL